MVSADYKKFILNPFSDSTRWLYDEIRRLSDYLWEIFDEVYQNHANLEQGFADHEAAYNPHGKVTWVYPYEFGPIYRQFDMVNDNDWLMIANKQTADRASPQPIGSREYLVPDAPTWTPKQHTGVVKTGVRISNISNAHKATNVRVWIAVVSADAHYRLTEVDNNTGLVQVGQEFNGDILAAPGWVEFVGSPEFLLPGDDLTLFVTMHNSATSQTYNHPWSYEGSSNQNVDPGAGNTTRRGDHSILHISSEDGDAVNRDTELGQVITGSTIKVQAEASSQRFLEYEVVGAHTDMSGWWMYEVALVNTGASGEPTVGERCQLYFDNPVLVAVDYVELSDAHLNQPAVNGVVQLDDGAVTENNNSYGLDVLVQKYAASEDWDMAAEST